MLTSTCLLKIYERNLVAMADSKATAAAEGATSEPKVSKRAAEKEAKKLAAKAKKEASKATSAVTGGGGGGQSKEPVDPFKSGWLKGVYNEKPVNEVQTRFPPEPNGYLHIGHAKAITVNFGFARSYGGLCNLRYDDTNPAKEEEQFFTSIKQMVQWLGFEPARITYSSNDFDRLYELAEELIRRGKAYVCHCSQAEVKRGRGLREDKTRGPRSACKDWSRSPEENLEQFRWMRDGKYEAGTAHLRMKQYLATKPEEYEVAEDDSAEAKKSKAKLKALADNPALWDVAAYRVKKPEDSHHHRTGDKWRIYPTYEFTHCLCDSFENISHSLCTVEFETLRPAYNWLLEALDIKLTDSDEKGPMQREYGRLNVEGTILSKRRIEKLVNGFMAGEDKKRKTGDDDDVADGVAAIELEEEGDTETAPSKAPASSTAGRKIPPVVRDWDDPRLFTLVALRRRGVPPGALKKFVLDQGVTKANSNTMTHNLDATIRAYLERTVPRLMLVLDPIPVIIENLPVDYVEEREVPFDPKDKEKGTHKVPFTHKIYIDRDDFRVEADPDFFRLAPGKSVGLLNVEHPILCKSFTTDPATGKVDSIIATYGADVPTGKSRIHWVGHSPAHSSPVKAQVRFYNALFKSSKPNELDWDGGGYYDNVNPESEVVYPDPMIESGFEWIRTNAPWPKEEGEAKGVVDVSSVRFQGLRTGFFAVDKESAEGKGKVVLNRIVSLREDTGKN